MTTPLNLGRRMASQLASTGFLELDARGKTPSELPSG